MKEKIVTSTNCWISISMLLFWMICGYFVYGGIDGALAMFVCSFIIGLVAFLSFIPFVGIFLQYWVSTAYAFPFIFDLTHVEASWVTTAIFAVDMIVGVFFYIIFTALALIVILEKFKQA